MKKGEKKIRINWGDFMEYRKTNEDKYWHWCPKCTNWPKEDYNFSDHKFNEKEYVMNVKLEKKIVIGLNNFFKFYFFKEN